MSQASLYQRIYRLIGRVPAGRVTTYGRVARAIGCTPRTVGFALAALPEGSGVPWQRVVNRHGGISPRRGSDGEFRQRVLLEAEGVGFDLNGRVDLDACGWSFDQAG